jgi:hypothetical protein
MPVLFDYQNKLTVMQQYGGGQFSDQIVENLKEKLQATGLELAITYRNVSTAISKVDEELNKMGVLASEIDERKDVLIAKDYNFLKSVIRATPKVLPKNIFDTPQTGV